MVFILWKNATKISCPRKDIMYMFVLLLLFNVSRSLISREIQKHLFTKPIKNSSNNSYFYNPCLRLISCILFHTSQNKPSFLTVKSIFYIYLFSMYPWHTLKYLICNKEHFVTINLSFSYHIHTLVKSQWFQNQADFLFPSSNIYKF